MASHEGSRKRLKVSRTESRPSPSIMASTSSSAHAGASKCTHEQSLKALQIDVDAMRQIITCKICHHLLYEPYSLACGHTYCYSCLSQWLVDQHKKTCPDCRAVVNQQPTPSYLIRELVLVFVSRNELLPDGETTEEHHGFVKEEAEAVAKDKANTDPRTGGLFKGCFKRGYHGYIGPIHDAGDGVDRCPTCHWELEEGYCAQCQAVIEPLGFSDYDDDSDNTEDELDHELDLEDAAAVFGADGQDDYLEHEDPEEHRRWLARERRLIDLTGVDPVQMGSSDDEDDSLADDEEEGNLTGFVVDDDDVEYQSSDDEGSTVASPPNVAHRSNTRRRAPVVVVSDDEHHATASAGQTSESEEDSEDEGPVALGSQRYKRGQPSGRLQRGRRIVSSDEEESSTHDEEDHENRESTVDNYGGFSPLDNRAVWGSASNVSEYDTDGASTIHPMDDEDRYADHGYHDYDDEEDDESDGSDAETGWGNPHETPPTSRRPPSTSSHRLHTLGSRSNRYTDSSAGTSTRTMSSANGSYRRHLPSTLDAYSAHAPPSARFPTYPYYGTTNRPSPPRGMFRPHSESVRLPTHPFQLGNTLNEVNNRTAPVNRTYNQRNHQVRANPAHRAVSATSSRSSAAGGVEVQGSSSGSSSTLRAASSGRRKRLLSISSDDSVEEARRSYDY